MSAAKETRIDLASIKFPQSACSRCGFIGSRVYPGCDCGEEFLTLASLREYRALMRTASPTRPPWRSRYEASYAGWAKRRA